MNQDAAAILVAQCVALANGATAEFLRRVAGKSRLVDRRIQFVGLSTTKESTKLPERSTSLQQKQQNSRRNTLCPTLVRAKLKTDQKVTIRWRYPLPEAARGGNLSSTKCRYPLLNEVPGNSTAEALGLTNYSKLLLLSSNFVPHPLQNLHGSTT